MDAQLPATHLLYRAEHGELPPTGPCICWLCGHPCPPASSDDPISRDAGDVVRSTFSDHAKARRGGDSEVCCHACAWYFEFKILRPGGARGMGFYTKTILVLGHEWREWDREQMADDLLSWYAEGLPDVAVLSINYSKKKHVIPWARPNPKGSRRPWIDTDTGRVRLPDGWPALLGVIAELWAAGYGKGQLAAGQLNPYVLSKSPQPARDLMLVRLLDPYVGTPTIDLATYVVTEDNRDRLARELAPSLPGFLPPPAESGSAGADPECSGGSVVQEPLRPAVVGDRRGARKARRDDEPRPREVEQLGFL